MADACIIQIVTVRTLKIMLKNNLKKNGYCKYRASVGSVMASACNAGGAGSIPGAGRCPERRKWLPLSILACVELKNDHSPKLRVMFYLAEFFRT